MNLSANHSLGGMGVDSALLVMYSVAGETDLIWQPDAFRC